MLDLISLVACFERFFAPTRELNMFAVVRARRCRCLSALLAEFIALNVNSWKCLAIGLRKDPWLFRKKISASLGGIKGANFPLAFFGHTERWVKKRRRPYPSHKWYGHPRLLEEVDQLSEAIEVGARGPRSRCRDSALSQPARHDSGLSTRPVRTFTSLGLQVSMPIFHFSSARAREAAGRALFQQPCRALRWSRPTVVLGRVRSRDFEIYWLQPCYFKNI